MKKQLGEFHRRPDANSRLARQPTWLSSTAARCESMTSSKDDILFEDIGRTFGFTLVSAPDNDDAAPNFAKFWKRAIGVRSTSKGYFPQVSGFRVCVDRSRHERDRIVSLQVPTERRLAEIIADKDVQRRRSRLPVRRRRWLRHSEGSTGNTAGFETQVPGPGRRSDELRRRARKSVRRWIRKTRGFMSSRKARNPASTEIINTP